MYTEEELENGMLNNDPAVRRYLRQNVEPRVIYDVCKKDGTPALGRDCYECGYVNTWRKLQSGEYQRGNLKGYLYEAGVNWWKYHQRTILGRKSKEELSPDLLDHEPSSLERILLDEGIRAIHACLRKMDQACAELLTRFYFGGEELVAIAAETDSKPETIRKRRERCFKILQACVKSQLGAK